MKKSQKLLYEPLPLLMYGEEYCDNFNTLKNSALIIQTIIDNWKEDIWGELSFLKDFEDIHKLNLQEMYQFSLELHRCIETNLKKNGNKPFA